MCLSPASPPCLSPLFFLHWFVVNGGVTDRAAYLQGFLCSTLGNRVFKRTCNDGDSFATRALLDLRYIQVCNSPLPLPLPFLTSCVSSFSILALQIICVEASLEFLLFLFPLFPPDPLSLHPFPISALNSFHLVLWYSLSLSHLVTCLPRFCIAAHVVYGISHLNLNRMDGIIA